MKPSGLSVWVPKCLYPAFKRVFWRHMNGTIFTRFWAKTRIVREDLTRV